MMRMFFSKACGLVFLAFLAGCSDPIAGGKAPTSRDPAISPLSVAVGDACEASKYEYLTGQPDTALEQVYILSAVRVLRPGEPIDRAVLAERLNFEINSAGRIARVFCG